MATYDNYTPEISYGDDLPVNTGVTTPDGPEMPQQRPPRKRRQQKQNIAEQQNKAKNATKEPKVSWFKKAHDWLINPTSRLLFGIFLGCLTVYLGVSFFSYFSNCIKDQSVINATAIGFSGKVGNAGGEGVPASRNFL